MLSGWEFDTDKECWVNHRLREAMSAGASREMKASPKWSDPEEWEQRADHALLKLWYSRTYTEGQRTWVVVYRRGEAIPSRELAGAKM